MRDLARDILELLSTVYPGHPWSVNVYGDDTGGGYFIRHLDFPSNWGMNQPRAHHFASASELRDDVIRKGGEILERSGLQRKRWNEDPIKKMEGVPEKWQPVEYRDEQSNARFEAVIAKVEDETRTEIRPQALKELGNG